SQFSRLSDQSECFRHFKSGLSSEPMKKMFLKLVLLCLCVGHLGGEKEEDKNDEKVFVKEGDSVTLNSGLSELKNDDVLEWKFAMEESLIAKINNLAGRIAVFDGPDKTLRGRLNVDNQTGSLTIKNITIKQTGFYKLQSKSVTKTFLLIIQDEISVKEGDSVTLNSGFTELKKNELVLWDFCFENEFIPLSNYHIVHINAAGGIFRDRLKVDIKTGSLIFRNTRTEHAGYYLLNTADELYRGVNLTVYG
ncbi:hypothetical protein F2P79_025500, partial [Pimephales promelas]